MRVEQTQLGVIPPPHHHPVLRLARRRRRDGSRSRAGRKLSGRASARAIRASGAALSRTRRRAARGRCIPNLNPKFCVRLKKNTGCHELQRLEVGLCLYVGESINQKISSTHQSLSWEYKTYVGPNNVNFNNVNFCELPRSAGWATNVRISSTTQGKRTKSAKVKTHLASEESP